MRGRVQGSSKAEEIDPRIVADFEVPEKTASAGGNRGTECLNAGRTAADSLFKFLQDAGKCGWPPCGE